MRQLVVGGTVIARSGPAYVIADIGHNHQDEIAKAKGRILRAHAFAARARRATERHDARLRSSRRHSLAPHPYGDALEVFIRREDIGRFVEEVRRDHPEVAATLRIEERELEGVSAPN